MNWDKYVKFKEQKGAWILEEPWEWDKTGKIQVYSLSETSDDEVNNVIEIITNVITEFALPLVVEKGNAREKDDLDQLVQKYSDQNEIDFNKLENELNRRRREAQGRETEFLPCGIVLVVNDKYSFKKYNGLRRAIYGMGNYNGLIVIRRKYINATRHEFGHMIGLDHHTNEFGHVNKLEPNENCIMEYEVNHDNFCKECQNEIKYTWEL